ncbi:MAG: CPBP family intramembrane metalloprotease [Bacteroidaceae bacterium]|nr:CPBP family intramembrane metalloprotease [Bacteroidaceae bacterium]
MKPFVKPILAVVVFLLFQALGGIFFVIFKSVINPGSISEESLTANPTALGSILIVSGLFAVLACWLVLKMIRMKETFDASRIDWGWACVAILAAVAGIFASDLLSERFELPNLLEEQIKDMAHNFWGILAVAIIGPVVEELVFREAILGHMLRNRVEPWTAMIVSAILFGAIHMNPAQIPFAAIMGLLLAIIYYKTGNIIITSIIHILNNSLAVFEMNLLGDKVDTFSYTEWMGGQTVASRVIFLGAALSIYLIWKYWKNVKEPVYFLEEKNDLEPEIDPCQSCENADEE